MIVGELGKLMKHLEVDVRGLLQPRWLGKDPDVIRPVNCRSQRRLRKKDCRSLRSCAELRLGLLGLMEQQQTSERVASTLAREAVAGLPSRLVLPLL